MKPSLSGTVLFLAAEGAGAAAKTWTSKLSKQGLEVVQLSTTAAVAFPKELEAQLSTTLSLVFFLDDDANATKNLAEKIRGLAGAFKFAPFILVTDQIPGAGCEWADDVVGKEETPGALKVRLQLRLLQARQRAETWQRNRDANADIAKRDVALKQREEFLSVCAHDLRSPLGLVQSSIGLLLNSDEHSKSLTKFQKELLSRAERQARQAIGLVKDLLDVTSLEQGLKPHYQLLNLNSLLEEFYQDYAFQARQKGVDFHYANAIKEWRVLGDSERVRQLLQNLFSNALKFTNAGKNIFLEVVDFRGRRKTDPPYPMIVISLRDEGPGIPKAEIQKIFDRFNQIKDYSRSEGRGLGLTVAKQISQLHDGNVWAESEPGKGATFRVLFPHVISRTQAGSVGIPPKKILIVEPNNDVRQNHYQKLREWGHELVFAKDGVEAVTFAFHEWADLIILSPELTKIPASDVTKMLKADSIGGKIPVLLAMLPGRNTGVDAFVVDGQLPLPLTKESWTEALKSLGVPSKRKAA